MEEVLNKKRSSNQKIPVDQVYQPVLPGGLPMEFDNAVSKQKADALWQAFNYWQSGGATASAHTQATGNVFMDTINGLFGTDGLYSMRRNRDVHPLAQLVGVGKSLIHSAIRNLGVSVEITAANNITGKSEAFAGAAGAYIGFSLSITMIALTIGFILFYIVPFLPFIYFFFAVGGWVKGIFEAMVGVPLWALAHIRIDGEGLFGPSAGNGYYLIFEIFIRPILIIFGLLASVLTFSALVSVLNDTWDIVTSNLAGFDVKTEEIGEITTSVGHQETANALVEFFRGPVDEFFFTVIYTVIVYMMAMSSFKLIDLIPNNILRWMGQSVSTFNDEREDAAKSMMGTAAVGSQQAIDAVGGGIKGVAQSANAPPPKSG